MLVLAALASAVFAAVSGPSFAGAAGEMSEGGWGQTTGKTVGPFGDDVLGELRRGWDEARFEEAGAPSVDYPAGCRGA